MALLNKFLQIFINLITITTLTHSAQLPPVKRQATLLVKEPTVQIQCLQGSILITIKNAPASYDGFFSGRIYPKGLAKNSTCLTEYRDYQGPLKYKLPLRSCNTMPIELDDGSIEFFNTVVLQPHLKLMTDLGRGYHIRCRYKNRESAIKSTGSFDVSKDDVDVQRPQAYTSDEKKDRREHGRSLIHGSDSPNEIPMPACHMKIYSGNKLAENVQIGDQLKLIVNIDKQEQYGLHVTDCSVRDGLGWGEQRLIDATGCPLDQEIVGPFAYDSDRTKATVSFPAHKFPYTTSVYYQCNVRLCSLHEDNCHKTPSCNGTRRTKRATDEDEDGLPATIEVFSGLYVNENAEVIDDGYDSVLKEKNPDDAICVSQRSFAIAVSITGLCLMLAVVLAVLCILARRRDKNTSSNSGSSIYSGPYTNTAYSHTS